MEYLGSGGPGETVEVRLNEICRSCLMKTNEIMTNFCEKNETATTLITMLASIGNFEIEVNDVLPSYVCRPCEEKLKFSYEFQQQLQRSEEIIRQCLITAANTKYDNQPQLLPNNSEQQGEIDDMTDTYDDPLESSSPPFQKEMEDVNVERSPAADEEESDDHAEVLAQFTVADVKRALEELNESFHKKVYCIKCGFRGTNMRALSSHMTYVHKDVKDRWCSVCNTEVSDLQDHYQNKHKPMEYNCKFCEKSFKTRSHYIEHLRSHGNIRPFRCDLCGKSFISSRHLTNHRELHTSEKPYKCPYCSKKFVQLSHLRYHTINHKNIICPSCKDHYETETLYKNHCCIKNEEQQQSQQTEGSAAFNNLTNPQNFCNECNKRVRSLKHHIAKWHSKTENRPVTITFLCAVCGKQCRSQGKLNIHMRMHTGEHPYKCSHCHRTMASRNQLVVHERIHTGEKPHACNICGKAFAQSSVLNTHMKIHTGRPEVCDICQKRFCRPAQLRLHMRKHTGEKPFICGICNQGFKQRSHLMDHQRTHSDERPYKCNYCMKAFKQRATLKTHVHIHLDKRPFKCSQCSYACRQSHSLTQHMKQHDADAPRPDNPHVCQYCHRGFNTMAMLTSHVERVHVEVAGDIDFSNIE